MSPTATHAIDVGDIEIVLGSSARGNFQALVGVIGSSETLGA
jgi:hypothetical protein